MNTPIQKPVRGGPWPAPATYEREPRVQAAFEWAVAKLWAADSWVNPLTAAQQQALFLNGAQAATDFLIRWADRGIPRSGERRPSTRFPELIA